MNKNKRDLNDLAKRAYEINTINGWGEVRRSLRMRVLLWQSEMMEMFEAWRSNKIVQTNRVQQIYSDFINTGVFVKALFVNEIKDTVGDELADTFIRIASFCYEGETPINSIFHLKSFEKREGYSILEEELFNFIDISTELVKRINDPTGNIPVYTCNRLIFQIEQLAWHLNIPLIEHIELKLEYNKTRGYRHGNKKV